MSQSIKILKQGTGGYIFQKEGKKKNLLIVFVSEETI